MLTRHVLSQPIQDIGEWISAGNIERWFAGAAGLRSELQGKCRAAGDDLADPPARAVRLAPVKTSRSGNPVVTEVSARRAMVSTADRAICSLVLTGGLCPSGPTSGL